MSEEKKTTKSTKEKSQSVTDKAKKILNDVKDNTSKYEKSDIEPNQLMAILSYVLPFIPYFFEKESKWVRFHAIQGMNLLIVAIISNIVLDILALICPILFIFKIIKSVINLCSVLLMIIGIINVCNGKARELPIINKIKLITK